MKKIYSVMIMCVAALTSMLFVSCEKRDIIPTETVLSVIDEEVTPSYTSCKVTCSFYTDATIEYASVQYSTTEDFARYNVTKMTKNTDDGSYSVELTKLQVNTTYYFRYEVNACVFTSSQADKVSEFQTLTSSVPVVVTTSVTDISLTSVTVVGQILWDAGVLITEYGVVGSASQNPTTENAKVKSNAIDSEGVFNCKLTDMSKFNTYYVRAYAISEKGTAYGNEIKFTTGCVDLGLSVKWATCNVGASNPGEYGDYFAWGETKPKSIYSEENYSFSSYPDILPLSNDAARANWGGSWRMPTRAEQDELLTECTWKWTEQDGTYGYKVTSKINGNGIFLPAAKSSSNSGRYWSSSGGFDQNWAYCSYAYYLYFDSREVRTTDQWRCYGYSVRPVCP